MDLNNIESVPENKKRPFDIFVLGPFLIWYGIKSKSMPPLARKIIVSAGIWQIYYHGKEYIKAARVAKNLATDKTSIEDVLKNLG
jgi:hypothetical protein